jgi:hypothetical protein
MRVRLLLAALLASTIVHTHTAAAQEAANAPFVGAWERIYIVSPEGKVTQDLSKGIGVPAFLIMSANGYFTQTTLPEGRPKLKKPRNEMTKEELLAMLRGVVVRQGTYTVSGNDLTRKTVTNLDPTAEDAPAETQQFRFEGDVMILTQREQPKRDVRFRRVK